MMIDVLAVCGAISIIGGAGAVIYKVVSPAITLNKRVSAIEDIQAKDSARMKSIEDMQKQQSKSLAAMLNHMITGNGVESMKEIRDELMNSIIDH